MASIAEQARLEAERAERESDDDDEQHDDEQQHDDDEQHELQPHPGDGLEEPSEGMLAELRAACDEHADHVRAIMGPFVDGFGQCAECSGIGIAYPKPQGRQLKPAPNTNVCSVCEGEGELATGSKRQGFDLIQCENCNGKGWVGPANLTPVAVAAAAAAAIGAPDAAAQPQPSAAPPATTDPRVLALQAEGFIVLPKPSQ